MPLFTELQKRVKNKYRTVSILKLCSFVRSNMEVFISGEKCSHILKMAERYCLYEHRKKRILSKESSFINLKLTPMRLAGFITWIDEFKALLIRYEKLTHTWFDLHYLSFSVILLRKIGFKL